MTLFAEVDYVPETASRTHSATVRDKKQRGVLSVPAEPPEERINGKIMMIIKSRN